MHRMMCTFQWITWALSGSRGRKKFLLRGRNLMQEQAHITRVCLQTNRLTRTSNSNHSWYYGLSVEVLKDWCILQEQCAHMFTSAHHCDCLDRCVTLQGGGVVFVFTFHASSSSDSSSRFCTASSSWLFSTISSVLLFSSSASMAFFLQSGHTD